MIMMEWIDVNVRLPEPNFMPVLVTVQVRDEEPFVALACYMARMPGSKAKPYWRDDGGLLRRVWADQDDPRNQFYKVTHWMPKPAPAPRRDWLRV